MKIKNVKIVFTILFLFTFNSCSKITKEITEITAKTLLKEETEVIAKKEVERLIAKSTNKEISDRLAKSRVSRLVKASNIARRRISVTQNNQYIKYKDFDLWLKIPGNNKKLILNKPKDGGVLRENLRMTMGKHFDKYANSYEYQAHHLVPGDKRYKSSEYSQKVLKKFQININDPMNGIILPKNKESIYFGTLHFGGHKKAYYDLVASKLKNAKTRLQCMEILDQIKNDLYKGKIELYNNHNNNSILSSFKK